MPQLQLPMFPLGVTHITALLAFTKEDGNIHRIFVGYWRQDHRR